MRYVCIDCGKPCRERELIRFVNPFGKNVFKCSKCRGMVIKSKVLNENDIKIYNDKVNQMRSLLENNTDAQVARHMNITARTIFRCINNKLSVRQSTVLKVIGKWR